MQVSHAVESDAFALVGGGEAQKFQINASGYAFKLMSDTLYRDKIRAVARETLCNAIDAHIAAGKPDLPVEVTLTDTELRIEDFGPGIPHEKIVPVYCTLFGSTKTQDKRQTGGFGLGAKAPFSITDHFTVINAHDGFKVVYAMTIGEGSGEPEVREMARVPHDKTGLAVSIPLESGAMRNAMDQALRAVVLEGGMKVRLNGKRLPTRDYVELKEHGFGLVRQRHGDYGATTIKVLYANVLYPLDHHNDLGKAIGKVIAFMPGDYDLVLYAKPDTIGITPSRESLSYDPITLKVLSKMLRRVTHEVGRRYPRFIREEMTEHAKKLGRDGLHNWRSRADKPEVIPEGAICGGEAIARFVARYNMRRFNIDLRQFTRIAARTLRDHTRILRKLDGYNTYIPSMRRYMDFTSEQAFYVLRRMVRIVGAGGAVDATYLRLTPGRYAEQLRKFQIKRHSSYPLTQRLFLAPTREAMILKQDRGFYVNTSKLTPEQIDAIKAKAEKLKVPVVELEKPEPRPKAPPKPKAVKGATYRRLTMASNVSHYGHVAGWAINDPEAFTPSSFYAGKLIRSAYEGPGVAMYSSTGQRRLLDYLGSLGNDVAVATNVTTIKKMEAAGIPRLESLVLDAIKRRVAKRKPYESFYAYMADFIVTHHHDSGSPLGFALKMYRRSRKAAHVAFGLPYRENADRDEAWSLWLGARILFRNRSHHAVVVNEAETVELLGIETLFEDVLTELLKKNPPGIKIEREPFPHLSLFARLTTYHSEAVTSLKDEELDRLCELVEENRKRERSERKAEEQKASTEPTPEATTGVPAPLPIAA